MYEAYWLVNGASSTTVIPGWQRMSYFAAAHTTTSSRVEQQQQAVAVWFMEHELDVQIRALHAVVGNAITEGRHIVVGTGSTQLYQAALYALSSPEQSEPTSVISAAPYYSVRVRA
jgi:L-tryptophan--pyruvate aminotransferase